MTIGEELEAYANKYPTCSVVMFADVSTGLVLATHMNKHFAQEELERLMERASKKMETGALQLAKRLSGSTENYAPWLCVSLHPGGCLGLIVSPTAHDAICLLLEKTVPLNDALTDATALLHRVLASA